MKAKLECKPQHIFESFSSACMKLETVANHYVFNPLGISHSSFRVLRIIYCKQRMTPSELLEFAGGTKSNVSQRINLLEHKGLVMREQPAKRGDRRNVFVKLTPKGKAMVEKIFEKFRGSVKELHAKFSESELNQHFEFITKLNQALDEKNKEIIKDL